MPWFLQKDGPFRADVAMYMGKHLEDAHEKESLETVLEILALALDSTVLMQHVLTSRRSLENLHVFFIKNKAWFSSHIDISLRGALRFQTESLQPHASLAWTAAYFGSADVFRMFLSLGWVEFRESLAAMGSAQRRKRGTMLHALVMQACGRRDRNGWDGFLQILKIVLDQPVVELDWVLTYMESTYTDGDKTFMTVLHSALGPVDRPRLCYDLCKVILSSRFGDSLIRAPYRFLEQCDANVSMRVS